MNTLHAYNALLKLNQISIDTGMPFYLSDGTLLGYRRERRLLPWDHDMDVCFFKETDGHPEENIIKFIDAVTAQNFIVNILYDDDGKIAQFFCKDNGAVEYDGIPSAEIYGKRSKVHCDFFGMFTKNGTLYQEIWFKYRRSTSSNRYRVPLLNSKFAECYWGEDNYYVNHEDDIAFANIPENKILAEAYVNDKNELDMKSNMCREPTINRDNKWFLMLSEEAANEYLIMQYTPAWRSPDKQHNFHAYMKGIEKMEIHAGYYRGGHFEGNIRKNAALVHSILAKYDIVPRLTEESLLFLDERRNKTALEIQNAGTTNRELFGSRNVLSIAIPGEAWSDEIGNAFLEAGFKQRVGDIGDIKCDDPSGFPLYKMYRKGGVQFSIRFHYEVDDKILYGNWVTGNPQVKRKTYKLWSMTNQNLIECNRYDQKWLIPESRELELQELLGEGWNECRIMPWDWNKELADKTLVRIKTKPEDSYTLFPENITKLLTEHSK